MIHVIKKDDNTFYIGSFDFSFFLNSEDNSEKIDNICEKLLKKKSENNIGPYLKINKNDTSLTCPICLEIFKEGLYKRVLLCSHVFHKKCIDKWIKNCNNCVERPSCPICRGSISII